MNWLSRMLEKARREDQALAEIEVWESIPEEGLTGAAERSRRGDT